jgi:dolichol-phosphate mannosyltransferase
MSPAKKPIPALSAVMPAYNEEEVLPQSLQEAVEALEQMVDDWELIIVDDGSLDRTPAILAEWSAKEPRIRVLTNTPNWGYSKALARGLYAAEKDAVFYTDSDAQFDYREITRLYPYLKDYDMVCGYRDGRKDPPIRFVTSFVYNKIQSLVLWTNARDVNCAFKLYRKSYFEKVKLSSDGFLIDAEFYIRAKRAGLTWTQVGVTHRPRTMGSTTVKVKTIVDTLRQLWQLRRSV